MEESISFENKLQKYHVILEHKNNLVEEVETEVIAEKKEDLQIEPDKKKFLFNFFSNVKVNNLLEMVGEEGRY